MMGLTVSVYRCERRHFNGDCSNGGISANALNICLVNVEGPSLGVMFYGAVPIHDRFE